MRGFRLYHPGDRSAAIVPRVGLFRQKTPLLNLIPVTARRPRTLAKRN